MRRKIGKRSGFDDDHVNGLVKDLVSALDSVVDSTIVKTTVVWAPPFTLLVNHFGGDTRLNSPDLVECGRAVNLTDSTVLVAPGGCAWAWVGQGQVRIDAVSGLTGGVKYELVFKVTG